MNSLLSEYAIKGFPDVNKKEERTSLTMLAPCLVESNCVACNCNGWLALCSELKVTGGGVQVR